MMTAQILDIGGAKMAVLPFADYERLLEMAEENADAAAAAAAQDRRGAGEEYLPAEMVDRLMAGETALKVWRQHRGMTLQQLGDAAGVGRSMLSEMENGNRTGTIGVWRRLAEALCTSIDEIAPEDSAE